ncbi:MAG TPA: cytidine deaminase [bacterium]|nr:cytidine deaminase [bacterium]
MTVKTELLNYMIQEALTTRNFGAYAPYSNFKVGAILFVQNARGVGGGFFFGANVENASFGLTICAERVAIFSAVAAWKAESVFDTMVIATKNGSTSCGACLQVMMEFNPDMDLIFVNEDGKIVDVAMVKDLLRSSFVGDEIIEG